MGEIPTVSTKCGISIWVMPLAVNKANRIQAPDITPFEGRTVSVHLEGLSRVIGSGLPYHIQKISVGNVP